MNLQSIFPGMRPDGHVLALGELLLDFIPIDGNMRLAEPCTLVKSVSGAAGIYACVLARYGIPCSMIGKLGSDPFSELARREIMKDGVDTEYFAIDANGKLGLAFLEYTQEGRNYAYYRNDSVGSRLKPEEVPEDAFKNASILHLPGMLLELNENMRESCFRAAGLAKKHGALISFDPNLRKEIGSNAAALARMRRMLSLSDIIEPTLEEARILTGYENTFDILKALHAQGPRLIILTMDKYGALFSFNNTVLRVDGEQVDAVDPTGAGDSFAAAFAYCLLRDMDAESALRFCNCTAALVCTRRGTIGMALPTLQQTLEFAEASRCHVRKCIE